MSSAKSQIGFLGAGRVGLALSRAFARAGEPVVAAWSRSFASAQALAQAVPGCEPMARAQDVADRCDIVFLCVPDDAIAPVAASLLWRPGKAAVHCSGAAEMDALARAADGAMPGAFHPLLMFSDPELAAQGLKHCAIAVEASGPLRSELERLVTALGATLLSVPAGRRAAYHAASHYAAAFVCVLMEQGETLLEQIGLDRLAARRALVSLARGALDAVDAEGPVRAMAGTYSRGDLGTAARHIAALAALDPQALPLYRLLAGRSVSMALEAGRIKAERAAELQALLAGEPEGPGR